MNVYVLAWTPHPVELIATAARLCYSKGGPLEALRDVKGDLDKARKLITSCVAGGHESVLEHASFTFGIEGISRACSHQLVRHRLTAISQQSQRYVDLGENEDYFVTPPTISRCFVIGPEYEEMARRPFREYVHLQTALRDEGRSSVEEVNQDARYVLPNACKTNLVWSMNFRELMHVCSVRLCARAQWEIRGVMERIVATLAGEGAEDDLRFLAGFLRPKCESLGYCPEGKRSCGTMPTKEEVLSAWKRTTGQLVKFSFDPRLLDPVSNPEGWKEAAIAYLTKAVSGVTEQMIADYVGGALDNGEAFPTTHEELIQDFFIYAAAAREGEEPTS